MDATARLLLDPRGVRKAGVQKSSLRGKVAKARSRVNGSTYTSNALQDRKSDQPAQAKSDSTTIGPISPPSNRKYDPRSLLNPRSKSQRASGEQRSASTLSSVVPLNSTSSGMIRGEDDLKRELQREDSGPKSMLEGLYGVERRVDQPRKKQKAGDGTGNSSLSHSKTSYAHRSNGIVGDYLKPGAESQSESATLAGLIDLTNVDEDSDEDICVTSSRNLITEQEVCYGHVTAVVHAHAVPKPKSDSIFLGTDQWPPIKCELRRSAAKDTIIEVLDPFGFAFGKLNAELAAALAPAMDGLRRLRTQARLVNRKKKDIDWPHQPCSDQLKMLINIYGRRGDVEKIGKLFGQHNLWFRQPMAADSGIETANPHAKKDQIILQNRNVGRGNVQADSRTLEEATEAVSKLFDHFASDAVPFQETDPPELIVTPLLGHQKQALTFLMQHERPRTFGSEESENSSLWRLKHKPSGENLYREVVSGIAVKVEPEQVLGGLLADVMGLGKTLEALALIATTTADAEVFGRQPILRNDPASSHLLAQAKATLIVSPVTTIKNWEDQISQHVMPDSLRYYIYHGPGRTNNVHDLKKYDVVITTYGTIASEFSGKNGQTTHGLLQQLKWFRIILDEAHTIRESRTTQSQAIYNLAAARRWCLTGTPIQNRIDDLGSLTRFLRMYPYDTAARFNQYIRAPAQSGDPSFLKALRVFVDSFTLRRLKDRIDLPKRQDFIERLTFSAGEKRLHDFFKELSHVKITELAQSKEVKSGIQHHVLRGIMTLRLICAHGRELLKNKDLDRLKGISVSEAIDLDNVEDLPTITKRAAYESITLMAEAELDLCRNCNKSLGENGQQTETEEDPEGVRCYVLPCFDAICSDCFGTCKDTFDSRPDTEAIQCPFCMGTIAAQYVPIIEPAADALDIVPDDAMPSTVISESRDYGGPHTKTKALLRDIAEMKEDSKPLVASGEPPIKCVVFSEFTSHLDLIERALSDHQHTFVRIDGSMSLNKRRNVLDALASDNSVTILLASIKAAGQGLNLTAASRAFIMEPMWNPAAETQAVDRIYRIGQHREVIVKRYQMNDSIELKIVELQRRKQALADISMNRNHKQLSKQETREQHMKDIVALFK